MINLLLSLSAILIAYALLTYLVMKRVIPWKYKGFFYGALVFFMLISVFTTFAFYDKFWKVEPFEESVSTDRVIK